MTPELDADTDELEGLLMGYADYMRLGRFESAVQMANKMTQMDCSVCKSFGNHLMGLAVGVAECPTNSIAPQLTECAIDSAEHIRTELVSE